jgi:hypothetical protein
MTHHEPIDRRGRGRWRIAMWGAAAVLLLLPLVAMQFTPEIAWDQADFAIFGVMLAVACGTFELAVRLTHRPAYRVLAGLALAGGFVLLWAQLAVGVF